MGYLTLILPAIPEGCSYRSVTPFRLPYHSSGYTNKRLKMYERKCFGVVKKKQEISQQ